ncbi:MAG: hypothetical protein ACPG7F_14915, partial [Aggregatilineales bacterium]
LAAGRLDEVLSCLDDAERIGRQYHHAPLVTETLLTRAEFELQQTKTDNARTHLDAAVVLIGHLQQPFLEMYYQQLNHRYLSMIGDTTEAEIAENKVRKLQQLLQIHAMTDSH